MKGTVRRGDRLVTRLYDAFYRDTGVGSKPKMIRILIVGLRVSAMDSFGVRA
jgi:hypothetical protein